MIIHSDSLAIFGNPPTFSQKVVLGLPNVGNRKRLLKRINDILDSRRLTNNGPYLQEFEERVANFIQVKHCIAVSNGTIGLQIVAKALGLHDEVIITPFTFIASAHALHWLGLKPVFCDVDPQTHNLSPSLVEEKITPRTTGIMGVHVWGRANDITALSDIAQRHNLRIYYDAAHAFGCSLHGQMIGSFGDAEVFSFHATKYINTLEGGAIVTNNDDLAVRMRMLRNFGFLGGDIAHSEGTNGKMNEISAAMGLTLMDEIGDLIDRNYATYKQYQFNLQGIPGIRFIEYDEKEKNNYQYIVIEVDENILHITRDELMEILLAENVVTKKYFSPGCHRMEPYKSYEPGSSFPVAELLSKRILVLPGGSAVSPKNAKIISQLLRMIAENGEIIHSRLQSTLSNGVSINPFYTDIIKKQLCPVKLEYYE